MAFMNDSFACDQALRMLRDHQLLVGRDDPRAHWAAARADAWTALLVGRAVELHPQPGRVAANALPQDRAVLPDAGREHERIESAERGRERTQLAPDPVDVEVHGEFRPGIVRAEQLAHVARDAGDAEQARLAVEQLLDRARAHATLVHEV